MINESNLYQKGMLVCVRSGAFAGRKQLDDDQLKDLPTEIVRGVHDLFDQDFKKLLRKVVKMDLDARNVIKKMSVPFPIDGFYFVLSKNLGDALESLKDAEKEREKLVGEIIENYDQAIKTFAEKYPEYYSRARGAYPTKLQLKDRFYFVYQCIKLAAPDKDSSIITSDQYKKEMRKFRETVDDMKKEIVGVIYYALLERTEKIKAQCTTKDGTPNQATFNSLSKFLDKIDETYAEFVDRGDLKAVIKKVKAQMLGVTAESLRDGNDLKKKSGDEMKSLTEQIKALPDVPLKRAIMI